MAPLSPLSLLPHDSLSLCPSLHLSHSRSLPPSLSPSLPLSLAPSLSPSLPLSRSLSPFQGVFVVAFKTPFQGISVCISVAVSMSVSVAMAVSVQSVDEATYGELAVQAYVSSELTTLRLPSRVNSCIPKKSASELSLQLNWWPWQASTASNHSS